MWNSESCFVHVFSMVAIHIFLISGATESYYFEEVREVNNSSGAFEVFRNRTADSLTSASPTEDITEPADNSTSALDLMQQLDDEQNEPGVGDIEFPDTYHAQGLISLPYDGIIEPFEAWYAGRKHMSRVDYYYGKWTLSMSLGLRVRQVCRYGRLGQLVLNNYRETLTYFRTPKSI